jgi:hypothetical protein
MSQVIHGSHHPTPEEVRICILYDPRDGRVLHHHMVETYPGADKVDQKEVEERAHARAARFGTDTSKAKALHLSPNEVDPSKRYKVDLTSLKLIELPRPSREPKRT